VFGYSSATDAPALCDRRRRPVPQGRRISRCWAGWGSWGSHFTDIVRLDQPAAGEPAQHPHAYLLGDDGEAVRRQCLRGSEADSFRDIVGLFERLEHPVDNAAMVVNVAVIRQLVDLVGDLRKQDIPFRSLTDAIDTATP